MNKFEKAMKALEQCPHECPEVYELLGYMDEAYVVVTWPDSQDIMDEPWFEDEAILDVDGKFGDSAYLIPIKYAMN